jgi:hypothetical protein
MRPLALLLLLSSSATANMVAYHHATTDADPHLVGERGLDWTTGYRDGESRIDVLPVHVPGKCVLTSRVDVAGHPGAAWTRLDGRDEARWSARTAKRTLTVRNDEVRPMTAELVVGAFGKGRSRVDAHLDLVCERERR